MKVDVLLINLPTNMWYRESLASSNSMPPLGVLYIASYLEKYDYTVKVIDFAIEKMSMSEFSELIKDYQPSVVGMSTYSESWKAEIALSKIIKELLPNVYIVAGGAFATFCFEDVLKKSKTDFVSKGEGEYSIKQLCDALLREGIKKDEIDVPGICYYTESGEYKENTENTEQNRIMDLDSLPYPDRTLVPVDKYTIGYTISTARGCPGDCIFCSSKSFWGKRVVLRSAKSVFDEVMYLYHKFNSNVFYITDDTFTASRNRCLDFCQMLKDSEINFVWGCESRADVVTEDFLHSLYDTGCHKIQFGLESADNEILNKIKKHVTIEQIENAVRIAYECGMHIQASYIIGHAFDTPETVEKTLAFAKHLRETYGARVVASVNTPFPGTEQYERREELGIHLSTNEWDKFVLNVPIISTNNFSTNELRRYLGRGQSMID